MRYPTAVSWETDTTIKEVSANVRVSTDGRHRRGLRDLRSRNRKLVGGPGGSLNHA